MKKARAKKLLAQCAEGDTFINYNGHITTIKEIDHEKRVMYGSTKNVYRYPITFNQFVLRVSHNYYTNYKHVNPFDNHFII